jgi:hypothetical protein
MFFDGAIICLINKHKGMSFWENDFIGNKDSMENLDVNHKNAIVFVHNIT